MRNPAVLCLCFTGLLSAAPQAERTAWQWQAPMEIGRVGMVRLELSPQALDVTRPDLGDMRVLSPAGVETPYLIEVPVHDVNPMRDAVNFKAALAGKTTVIEASCANSEVIEAVEWVTPAREFLKSLTIQGRQAGGEWGNLALNQVIFRQAGGAERLRVAVPAGVWKDFRITVDDGRTQPVPFTGVRLGAAAPKPATVELPVVVATREEAAGETRLTLDLGARNLDVAELCIEISDAVFSRTCHLAFPIPTADGGKRMEPLTNHVLYRVVGEQDVVAQDLTLPLRRRIPARYLIVTLHNGDSPPLNITGAKIRCYPTVLAFHATPAGSWLWLTGNRDVKSPDYDLGPLRGTLAAAGGLRILPGPLLAKPDYQVPPALPGVDPAGADIALTDWCRRRAVVLAGAGVMRIELDAWVMAGCRTDLGDLRLVRNGRQIPYLIQPGAAGSVMRELKPTTVTLRKDPKRPTVSRWEITLPVDHLPAADLTARSTAPMFSRRMVATFEGKDELGNAWTVNAGTADWTKSGGADSRLFLSLGGQRVPRTLVLETDHGDNPPIEVDEIVVRYATPSVMAKLTAGDPLFLYYGNPKAATPQYDLRLARNELLAAAPQTAKLGDEELLRPDPRQPSAVDAGSPWLWLALAAVVAVLLAIVAKLLPRPAVTHTPQSADDPPQSLA